MQIHSNLRVTVSDQVLCQKVGGETVLLDLASEQYFGLDEVGSRFWELLEEKTSFEEIVKIISNEYDVPQSQIELDLSELMRRLFAEGLVIEIPDTF